MSFDAKLDKAAFYILIENLFPIGLSMSSIPISHWAIPNGSVKQEQTVLEGVCKLLSNNLFYQKACSTLTKPMVMMQKLA